MRKHREKHQQNKSDEKSSSSSSSSSSSLDASEDNSTTPAAAESDMTSADSVASDAVQQTKSEVNDDATQSENGAIKRNAGASSASPETQLSPIFERSFKSPGKLKKREKSDVFSKTRSFQSDSSSTDLFNDDTIEESSTAPNNDDVMPATATAEHSTDDKGRFPDAREACDADSQTTISASASPEKTLPQSQQQYDNEITCSGTMASQSSDLAWLSQRTPEDNSQTPSAPPETTTQRSTALCDLIDGDVNDDDVSSCQAAVVTSAAVDGGQGGETEV